MHASLIKVIFDHLPNNDINSLQIKVTQLETEVVDYVRVADFLDEHFYQLRVSMFIDDRFEGLASVTVNY
jgi:FAD synthase